MGMIEKLEQALTEEERVAILASAIREAMVEGRTVEQYGDGRFALGYFIIWLKDIVKEN